jgi:hypothetical protein
MATTNKKVDRKGQLTGEYAVFYGTNDPKARYVVIGLVQDLAPKEADGWIYEWEPILAFNTNDGSLLRIFDEFAAERSFSYRIEYLCSADMVATFERCPDAYIYAKGLLELTEAPTT